MIDKEKSIIEKAKYLQPYIVQKRRDIHMHPELKYEEFRTSKIVEEELKKYGYKIVKTAKTGIIGILTGDKNGKTVGLRADMDALPIQEENDVPYKSKIPGKMHACGHDSHTAMLLGAAKILSEMKSELQGTIKLIFQPAEEGGLGAKLMVEEGQLDDVDAFFGLHVWMELPSGVIGIKEGPLLASADAFKATIRGKGGHGAVPHMSHDPIAVALDIANAYQKIISREIDPLESAVISVTRIVGGTAFNIIPESIEIDGTIRTFNEKIRSFIIERMTQITEGYAKAMRCDGKFEVTMEQIPPTINDASLAKFARETLKEIGKIQVPRPTLGAEDFSFYTRIAPGLFVLLGIRNSKKGIIYPHHHPRFNVDEDVLWMGSAIHSLLAYKFLEGAP